METDTKRIVLQMLETMLEQQQMLSDVAQAEKLVIEAIRKDYPSECVEAAWLAAHESFDSVFGVADRIQRLAEQVRGVRPLC